MAISRAQLLKELLPGLNELFGTEYEQNAWAVHADYNHADMKWKIFKIEPWGMRGANPSKARMIYKVEGAVDEMDAYKKFMGGEASDDSNR